MLLGLEEIGSFLHTFQTKAGDGFSFRPLLLASYTPFLASLFSLCSCGFFPLPLSSSLHYAFSSISSRRRRRVIERFSLISRREPCYSRGFSPSERKYTSKTPLFEMFAMPAFTRNTFEAHSPTTTTFPFSFPSLLASAAFISRSAKSSPSLASALRSCPCVGERKRRKRYEVIYNRGGEREEGGGRCWWRQALTFIPPPLPSLSRSSLSAGENNKGVGGGGEGRRERREGRHHHKSCWKFPSPLSPSLTLFFFRSLTFAKFAMPRGRMEEERGNWVVSLRRRYNEHSFCLSSLLRRCATYICAAFALLLPLAKHYYIRAIDTRKKFSYCYH